jgi:L-cysteine desulfidase
MTGVGPRRNQCLVTATARVGSGHQGGTMSIYEYVKLMEYAHKLEEENERLRQCVMVHEAALVSLWVHARKDHLS